MADDADNQENTSLVPAGVDPRIAAAVKNGTISDLPALIKAFEAPPLPVKQAAPALPVRLSEDEGKALVRLPEVYCSVVPEQRRTITPAETDLLLDERAVLKMVEGAIKRRLDDIALTANIHNTVALNEALAAAEAEAGDDPDARFAARQRVLAEHDAILDADGNPFYTDKGHVAAKGRILGEDEKVEECFSIETRAGKADLSSNDLKALSEDPDEDYIDHKDYLSMTTQIRVFDPAKAMLAVRKKPAFLRAIAKATKTSLPSVSVNVRKRQGGR